MIEKYKIPLVKNAITSDDFIAASEWLKTGPQITQGPLVERFEKEFAKWSGVKYAVFCNSGSSANLLALEAYKYKTNKQSIKSIIPNLSWITTIAPVARLREYTPILCDACKDTLSIDIDHFEQLCIKHNPDLLFLVPVLGVMPKMKEILEICGKYHVDLILDSCETIYSKYSGKNTAQYGLMTTYSTFIGHVLVSGEGGFITTDDKELYNLLISLRNHGWLRNWSEEDSVLEFEKYNIDEFDSQYSFFSFGYNLRSMELNAFFGLRNLKKLDDNCERRKEIFQIYDQLIKNDYWKIKIRLDDCGFSYPLISPKRKEIVLRLNENGVSSRPLIAGSLYEQPVWKKYGNDIIKKDELLFSSLIHKYGFYVPIFPEMSNEEVEFVCKIINETINE